MTQNQLAYLKYAEDVRANKAKEGENYRTNLANEAIKRSQAESAEKQAAVAEANLYKTKVLGQELPIPGLMYATGRSSTTNSPKRINRSARNVMPSRSVNDLVRMSLENSQERMSV